MAEPFLAEIKLIGFNFAPRGWALCDGQILPISQHQSLYSLLGTMYGGNGRTEFALPDLRGRAALHHGTGFSQGSAGGEENVTLNSTQMPSHAHACQGSCEDAVDQKGTGLKWATTGARTYSGGGGLTSLNSAALGNAGGGQSHNNMQPYLVLNFVIALTGVFPPR